LRRKKVTVTIKVMKELSADDLLKEFAEDLKMAPPVPQELAATTLPTEPLHTETEPDSPTKQTKVEPSASEANSLSTSESPTTKESFLKLVSFIQKEQKKKKSSADPKAQIQARQVKAYQEVKETTPGEGPKITKGLQINKAA
jgi:hypothetical protein